MGFLERRKHEIAFMTELIHKELSFAIVGCVFDVHNALGPGLREECYQKAMEQRLYEQGLPFLAKPATRSDLVYRGEVVDTFEPDLVVADRVIPELKHQVEGFVPENEAQVLNYLKFWKLELGLLVNFAQDKAVFERIPHQPPPPQVDESYDYIADLIQPTHKPTLRAIREGLLEIFRVVGLGYTATTYRRLALVEFLARQLAVLDDVVVEPSFHERRLPRSSISPFLVNQAVCVQVDAINDVVSARLVRTMQTHLQLTGMPLGIVASFGRRTLSIRGVRP
jgi:GxxExxY protein